MLLFDRIYVSANRVIESRGAFYSSTTRRAFDHVPAVAGIGFAE